MKRHSFELVPYGTARARFIAADAKRGERLPAWRMLDGLKASLRAHDLAPETADVAWELINLDPELDARDRRALLHLAIAALIALAQGSTRLPLRDRDGRAWVRDLLVMLSGTEIADDVLTVFDELAAARRAPLLLGGPNDFTPLVLDDGHLYIERMLREEDRFVGHLAKRIARAGIHDRHELDAALADVKRRPPVGAQGALELSEEQLHAVERALSAPFTVISGGPGTGKTSIVAALLRVLVRLGLPPESIAIAAPTGKAANRIAEAVRKTLAMIADPSPEDTRLLARAPEPQTLHRLLGYSPRADRFVHHENNRLSERTVIVDESSMIDLVLMERLVRSVRDDARLVLLGDAEQLPSVDAGAVLRDITAREQSDRVGFAVTLTKSFRMDPRDPAGKSVLEAARAIKEGDAELLATIVMRAKVRDLAFSKVEMIEIGPTDLTARRGFLDHWFRERIADERLEPAIARTYRIERGVFSEEETKELSWLWSQIERSKILCITRGAMHPTGAEAVNAVLHERARNEAGLEREASPIGASRRPEPIAGEPIIVQRNDYERRLFNGDQGVVVRASEAGAPPVLMAVFPSSAGFVAHRLDALGDQVALSYAMTVHKAQGSELDHVALLLPERDMPLLTREILYTALTRSRRSVVIVGSREVLAQGVARRIKRYSGIREKLTRALISE